MFRVLLAAAVLATVACDETTRVVGASPSVVQTATTGGQPTSSAATRTSTPAPTATATPAPATTSPTQPPTTSSPAATRTTAPVPTVTAAAPTPGAAAPALGACADEASQRPQPGTATVPIVFSNQSGATRQYLSLDAQGARVLTRALASGTSYTQTAHVGDVWIVASGTTCLALYRVTAAALVISSPQRQSLVPLYAIAGIVTDARTGAALSGQTVFIWQPDESSCSIIGGTESPGYIVSSITGTDGTYRVYVTPGDYKIRVRTTAGYAPQWWNLKPALTAGHCASADVVSITADTFQVNFPLQPQ